MMRTYPTFYRFRSSLQFVIGITLLMFCLNGQSKESPAGQETSQHGDNKPHWGYGPNNGPASWGKMYRDWSLCAEGKAQSPIDLAGGAVQKNSEQMKLAFPPAHLRIVHQTHVLEAIDNGHTIQINYDQGETLTIGNKSYELRQYHFHSPSEHTVNGRHFPMEMHLVHVSKDGRLAVIGVLIEEGQHNAAFNAIWSNLPQKTGQEVHIENVQVNIDDMLPRNKRTYRYSGSLTTPPCSEDVRWFVYAEPIKLSGDQITAFRNIFHGNNRPTQPLNARTLQYDVVGETIK